MVGQAPFFGDVHDVAGIITNATVESRYQLYVSDARCGSWRYRMEQCCGNKCDSWPWVVAVGSAHAHALTPEQRVRVAEETLRLTGLRQVPTNNASVGFDRYEDFLDWKRNRDL